MQKFDTKYKKLQNNSNNSLGDKLFILAIFVVNMTTNIIFYPVKVLVSFDFLFFLFCFVVFISIYNYNL